MITSVSLVPSQETKKISKLMIYVRAETLPMLFGWAIRLSETTPTFGSLCVGHSMQNMERGLNVRWM